MEHYKEFPYTSQILDCLIEKSKLYHTKISFDYLADTQKSKISPSNRECVIHWLSDICSEKGFSPKIQELTISYLDLFLSKKLISDPSLLELITYICLSISLNYENLRLLSFTEIYYLCRKKFTLEVIKTTQLYILNLLGWELEIPTPGEILVYLLLTTCENFDWEAIRKNTEGFILIARSDYDISRESHVSIAIASALCVFEKFKLVDFAAVWLQKLSESYGFQSDVLKDLAKRIWDKVRSFNFNN